jgi:hypothetical protein
LTAFLLWRKWVFDVDNRAGQETGYLFEPIIAAAIGGVPVSAKKSPVRRTRDGGKGRQVDCIRDDRAYEFKIRVTIAASGQGRWGEELEFPGDCRSSGFTPVLLVLDPTPNVKLDELCGSFLRADGEVYIGERAWGHLRDIAGPTMTKFLERYVHEPLRTLLDEVPVELPSLTMTMTAGALTVRVGDDEFDIRRTAPVDDGDDADIMPADVDEQIG